MTFAASPFLSCKGVVDAPRARLVQIDKRGALANRLFFLSVSVQFVSIGSISSGSQKSLIDWSHFTVRVGTSSEEPIEKSVVRHSCYLINWRISRVDNKSTRLVQSIAFDCSAVKSPKGLVCYRNLIY